MQELEKSWDRVLPIWWIIIWRGVLGTMVISLSIALLFKLVGSIIPTNLSDDHYFHLVAIFFQIARILIIAAAFFVWWPNVVRMALKKRYSGFRIALVPTTKSD